MDDLRREEGERGGGRGRERRWRERRGDGGGLTASLCVSLYHLLCFSIPALSLSRFLAHLFLALWSVDVLLISSCLLSTRLDCSLILPLPFVPTHTLSFPYTHTHTHTASHTHYPAVLDP